MAFLPEKKRMTLQGLFDAMFLEADVGFEYLENR